jgi:DNA polymerase-3 subunit delta
MPALYLSMMPSMPSWRATPSNFLMPCRKSPRPKRLSFLFYRLPAQFQLMDVMRAEMEEKRVGAAGDAISTPGICTFKRKPVMEQALRAVVRTLNWRELNRLQAQFCKPVSVPPWRTRSRCRHLLSTTPSARNRARRS